MSKFAFTLEKKRKLKRLTQKQVAEIIGVKLSTYQAWEQTRSEPNIRNLSKIAKFFKWDILTYREAKV